MDTNTNALSDSRVNSIRREDVISFFGSIGMAFGGMLLAREVFSPVLSVGAICAVVFASAFLPVLLGIGQLFAGETARKTPIAGATGGAMMGALAVSVIVGPGQWLLAVAPFALAGAISAHYLSSVPSQS